MLVIGLCVLMGATTGCSRDDRGRPDPVEVEVPDADTGVDATDLEDAGYEPDVVASASCDEVQCGTNEVCVVFEGQSRCLCADGFINQGQGCVPFTSPPQCGDGVREGNEECDEPGADQRCAAGESECLVCNDECRLVPGVVVGDSCGDGIVDEEDGEECDGDVVGLEDACVVGAITCGIDCRLDLSGCEEAADVVAVGGGHACAITRRGTVKCWGRNNAGQLGDGTNDRRTVAVDVQGLRDVTALALGAENTCALTSQGTVWCWGASGFGQLGNPAAQPFNRPNQVVDIADAVAITAGSNHHCAIRGNGQVLCWGSNFRGGLGEGTAQNRNVPTLVPELESVMSVSAGENFTCVALTTGAVKCWGKNAYGELGNGGLSDALSPVDVADVDGAARLVSGSINTCAILTSGAARCWGNSSYNQVGEAVIASRQLPIDCDLCETPAQLALNLFHTCVTNADGEISCWGENAFGGLGNGTDERSLFEPVSPLDITEPAISLAVGNDTTCVALESGRVKCWGRNDHGQLGDGTMTDRNRPVDVGGF